MSLRLIVVPMDDFVSPANIVDDEGSILVVESSWNFGLRIVLQVDYDQKWIPFYWML